MPAAGQVAVVIPAYRAAASLPAVIDGVRRASPGAVVLVVDDGSDDDTAAAARQAGARVVSHATNLGKGRALATGLAAAIEAGAVRFVVTLDADGQHPPEAIPRLLEPLEQGSADLVVGARRRAGAMPPQRRLSNWLSSTLVSRGLGVRVPDSQSGFRAMTRPVAAAVKPAGNRYEFETEFLFAAKQAGFRLGAVDVPTVYSGAASYFRPVSDTLRLSRVFLRHWKQILVVP